MEKIVQKQIIKTEMEVDEYIKIIMGQTATEKGTATTTVGEKKARNKEDGRKESKAMISNVRRMPVEIEEKNSKMREMEKTNRKLCEQNEHLRGELYERETEIGSEKIKIM